MLILPFMYVSNYNSVCIHRVLLLTIIQKWKTQKKKLKRKTQKNSKKTQKKNPENLKMIQ